MGARDLRTPHLDRLVAEGVTLDGYRTASPVCTPGRAAMLTGRHPIRSDSNRVYRTEDDHAGMSLDEITLPELLRDTGYTTGIFGKWHLGMEGNYRPTARGFDRFFGVLSGMVDYFTHRNLGGGGHKGERVLYDIDLARGDTADAPPVERDGYFTDLVGDAACDFIASAAQPFFAYVPFTAPHTPLQAPAQRVEQFAHIDNEDRRTFAAMVAGMDDAVGRILDAIDRHDREHGSDTLVIFTSDHGWDQRPSVKHVCDNGGLRSGKYTLFEGGLRVPCVMRGQGIPVGKSRDAPCVGMDLFNTMLDYAGIALPSDRTIDGRSLRGVLERDEPSPHDTLFWQYGPDELAGFDNQIAALRGTTKFVVDRDDRMLFDLSHDPRETTNIAADHRDVVDQLERDARAWLASLR